jgi:hypothetical protein
VTKLKSSQEPTNGYGDNKKKNNNKSMNEEKHIVEGLN